MHLSQRLFILVNLFPYIGLVFGASTQECGLFFGPSRIDGKYLCQNAGHVAYRCAPPQFPKIPLDNCVPYIAAPSLGGQVDTSATKTHQDCDTAKKHDDERFINCGMLGVVDGVLVSTSFRCDYNNWNLNVAYNCELIKDQNIEYEVDYLFPEYREYLVA